MPNAVEYWKNPEKYKKAYTEWYDKPESKEKRKIGAKKYYKTPQGIKTKTINNWKSSTHVLEEGETWEYIYKEYLEATDCNGCQRPFEECKGKKKCLDHNHLTGFIRAILCSRCNKLDIFSAI
tara:strand:+ start:213 stop:581 length:369 start_codon:yes stop_codon:yes gene_type:complete